MQRLLLSGQGQELYVEFATNATRYFSAVVREEVGSEPEISPSEAFSELVQTVRRINFLGKDMDPPLKLPKEQPDLDFFIANYVTETFQARQR